MISKGDYIKGYIVEERLGGGGFGEVYLVNDGRDPTRKYAMKIIRSELTYNLGVRESFLNEMLNMARLSQHPNILSIINSLLFNDEDGERVGMVTEYLEGTSLGFYIHRYGPLAPYKAIPIFLQVLDAIGYAHKMGIIHRDIKPSNIMLEPGKTVNYREYATHPVKVLDFGLSKALEGASAVESMSGATLSYAAPERFKKGALIDLRTDVYSLGITLFEMLVGRPPFVIRSLSDALEPAMSAEALSISKFIERCPAELDDIIRKSVAVSPSDRYATCEDMAKDLMAIFPPISVPVQPGAGAGQSAEKEPAVKEEEPAKAAKPPPKTIEEEIAVQPDQPQSEGEQAEKALPESISAQAEAGPESEVGDEADVSAPPPPVAASRKTVLPVAGGLVAVCLVLFLVFFIMKKGPEEVPPERAGHPASQQQEKQVAQAVQEEQKTQAVQEKQGTQAAPETVTSSPAPGQPGPVEETAATGKGVSTWLKTFGGANDEEAMCIRQMKDGAFIASGWSRSFGKGKREGWVFKLDPEGKEIWSKTYSGPADSTASSIQETSDSGFIVGGSTRSGAATNAWIVKLDAAGAVTWNKTFGAGGEDDCTEVLQTADGGYAFAGWTNSFGRGKSNAWLVKLDPSGKEVWKKTYGTAAYNGANAMVRTGDGGFALTGLSISSKSGHPALWVVRVDGNGKEIWSRTFGEGVESKGTTILQTRDGAFMAAGLTQMKAGERTQALVVKLDGSGKEVWSKTFGGNDDRVTSVQETENGCFLVAGYAPPSGKTKGDVWLMKLDADGNGLWTKTLGALQGGRGYFLQQTLDGGYVLTGSTVSSNDGKKNAFVVKVDSEGDMAAGSLPSANIQP